MTKPSWKEFYVAETRPLGEGGQARVLAARDRTTRVEVALKVLRVKDESGRSRMRREIDVMSRLHSPNIMPLLKASESASWYAMPRAGRQLGAAGRALDDEAIAVVVRHCLAGLGVAHAEGYVHRDVKPSNILDLGDEGKARWVLSDWGLVRKPAGSTTVKHTKTGHLLGTDEFAAPELWRDAHRADHRCDLYSLGRVVAWCKGCDLVPFRPAIPEGKWKPFVRRLTADDPGGRPTSAAEAASLLDAVLAPSPALPGDEVAQLQVRARAGDEAATRRLAELAEAHPDDAAVVIDGLPLVEGAVLKAMVRDRPKSVAGLVAAMRAMIASGSAAWGGRDFGHANECLGWILAVAQRAIRSSAWDLAEEAADALFELDGQWQRFDQRRRSRSWLVGLTGEAARRIADVLRRHPSAVRWYLNEGWDPEGADPRIVAALTGPREP
ncbi:MAG: protein kinase [Planctomycetes bacterium]|nr:protein kinase [Planctomycetota bacterium]